MRKIQRKGQLQLGDAPTIVLLVGLTFLIMATIAFIGEKYGDSFTSSTSATVTNETVTQAELLAGSLLDASANCNAQDFAISDVRNSTTATVITSGNYTLLDSTGALSNTTSTFVTHDWLVSYTYNYAGVACNVTTDMNTEIANNTSIAGIVLTISLVGIVLSILIGVFMGINRRTRI